MPEASKNKDLAYDFIDITMRPEMQELLGNSGGIPVAADPSKITDPKNQELIANFNKITAADGLAFYPDWPVPGYYDVLVSGFQSLINQSKTPAEVLDQIAGPYQTACPPSRPADTCATPRSVRHADRPAAGRRAVRRATVSAPCRPSGPRSSQDSRESNVRHRRGAVTGGAHIRRRADVRTSARHA